MDYIVGSIMFILGSAIASFLGVVIYRVPNGISVVKPSSFCPKCKKSIKWYDNIPIISYLILRGKCRYCKTKIGINSFFLELLGGLLFLFTFISYGLSYDLIFLLPIISVLIIIAGIDYNNKIIYDWSWILFLILTIGYVSYLAITNKEVPYEYFVGASIGFISFLLIRVVGKLIYKQEVLGMGDVILMGIAGLLLNYKVWLFALLVGSFVGSIIELSLIALKKRDRLDEIAFGPYLVLGIIVGIIIGNYVVKLFLEAVI